MTKKKLVETILEILEEWDNDHSADLNGPNSAYFNALEEIIKEEEEKYHECKK